MNAAARLIVSSSKYHSAPSSAALAKAPERIAFKQSVLVYSLHGSASVYLTDELCQVADVEARQRLRYSNPVLYFGDRAFPVAAARVWNGLPDLTGGSPRVSSSCCRIKWNVSYSRLVDLHSARTCPLDTADTVWLPRSRRSAIGRRVDLGVVYVDGLARRCRGQTESRC